MIEKIRQLYDKTYPDDSGDWPYFLECFFCILENHISLALQKKTLEEFEKIYGPQTHNKYK